MRRDETCKVVCRSKLSPEAAKNFKEKIDDEYRVNMYAVNFHLVISNQLYVQQIHSKYSN